MKKLIALFLSLLLTCSPVFAATSQLSVDAANHYLEDTDGNIVYILADTQWKIKALTTPQIDTMLQDRKNKGYNAIITSISTGSQDYAGNYPFTAEGDGDWEPDSLVANFWTHLDYIIEKADDLGMYVFLDVLWTFSSGTFIRTGDYENFTEAKTQAYAQTLGTRYASQTNVVWMLAGDHSLSDSLTDEFIDDIAVGIAAGDTGGKLITTHPTTQSTADAVCGDSAYIDFYSIQEPGFVSLAGFDDIYREIAQDYNNPPDTGNPPTAPGLKPVWIMEPFYEDYALNNVEANRDWLAHETRAAGWLTTFAGAFGFATGTNGVWQATGTTYGGGSGFPENNWDVAIDEYYGQKQLAILRDFIESRTPMVDRIPYQELLISKNGTNFTRLAAESNCCFAAAMTGTNGSGTETDISTGTCNSLAHSDLTETSGIIPTSGDSAVGLVSRDFEAGDSEYLTHVDGKSTEINGASQPLALFATIKLESLVAAAGWYGVITKYESTGDERQYAIGLKDDETIEFLVGSDGTTDRGIATSTGTVSTDEWTDIGGNYDPSQTDANQVVAYLNGVADGTHDWDNDLIVNGTAPFVIGASQSGDGNYADMLIGAVLVMDRSMTATEYADLTIVREMAGSGLTRVQCARDSNAKWAACYITDGHEITVDVTKVGNGAGRTCTAYELNPRTGNSRVLSAAVDCGTDASPDVYTYKASSDGIDWVLVIDDNAYSYSAP